MRDPTEELAIDRGQAAGMPLHGVLAGRGSACRIPPRRPHRRMSEHQDVALSPVPHGRFQVVGKVLVVVVEIRDHATLGHTQGRVAHRARSTVLRQSDQPNARVPVRPSLQHLRAAVAGAVVDGDKFPVRAGLPQERANRPIEQGSAVANGHDDRNRRGHGKSPTGNGKRLTVTLLIQFFFTWT